VTLEELSPSDADDNAVVFSGPTPLDGVAVDDGRVSERDSTEARHPHLFLSYSTLDHGIMHNVTKTLNAAGLQVWVDKQYLTPGDPSWRRAIQDAIERSRCVVVILSPDAKQSKWVEAELDYAESQHKKIFCILARGDRTSSALLGYTLAQWVDIQRGYDAEMNKLIDVLWKYLHDTK
ncbi:MAG: toll/interleukin-1 receptor domain-containing protein, partial [Armatimonadetes bacterium]|nr:toll/interleukin-1 receptor domain-containing protein [Anaerolineae bacterium]